MIMETDRLISELIEITKENITIVEDFIQRPFDDLKAKSNENSWSVLECIAHLNLYSEFYLPELKKAINKNITPPSYFFYPSFTGEYLVKSIRYKEKLNKMKTSSLMDPNGSILSKEVLRHFVFEQRQIIDLLDDAREVDINKIKTPLILSKWIKLRLGDTFRFVIYHNQRHVYQACLASGSFKSIAV